MFNYRLRLEGPDWGGEFDGCLDWIPHTPKRVGFFRAVRRVFDVPTRGGRGADVFGNCTLWFRCPLFSITWWNPTGHYQTDIEIPDPGVNEWIDRAFYGE